MTLSDPRIRGNTYFLVFQDTTFMSSTDGTLNTGLVYPFDKYSAEFAFSGLPTAAQTITVGSNLYTWRAAPGAEENAILIGADADACAENLRQALIDGQDAHSDATGSGTLYGSGTSLNPDILHAERGASDAKVHVTAASPIIVSETSGNMVLAGFDSGTPNLTGFMQRMHAGDYTEIKAHSTCADWTGALITGYGQSAIASGTPADEVVHIFGHDGAHAASYLFDATAGGSPFLPVQVNTRDGVSAKLASATDNQAVAVYFRSSMP